MKTIEEINGQKVWAVDSDGLCEGCMFKKKSCFVYWCSATVRPDTRTVIFKPYEEQKKTYTLSQINDVIDKLVRYSAFNHKSSFEDIIDVLNQFKSKLEQL